jgi:hypothetical protein
MIVEQSNFEQFTPTRVSSIHPKAFIPDTLPVIYETEKEPFNFKKLLKIPSKNAILDPTVNFKLFEKLMFNVAEVFNRPTLKSELIKVIHY